MRNMSYGLITTQINSNSNHHKLDLYEEKNALVRHIKMSCKIALVLRLIDRTS